MKILIIEDEPHAAARLRKYIMEVEPNAMFADDLASIEEVVEWFAHNPAPDLVFMDIHLSDGNCFEIFDQVQIESPIIFATAYDEYALRAFEHHSIDYILKPIKKKDVERGIAKLQRLQARPMTNDPSASITEDDSPLGGKRFLVKVGSKINLIKIDDIAYFYSKDKITFVITREGRRFPINKSLEMLDNELPSLAFFRINRKFIIHMESISGMGSHTKGRVKIKLDPPIEMESVVSTERSPHFKKWLIGS